MWVTGIQLSSCESFLDSFVPAGVAVRLVEIFGFFVPHVGRQIEGDVVGLRSARSALVPRLHVLALL